MTNQTRYASALASNPLFAEIMQEKEDEKKAPGYHENGLREPVQLSSEQQKKLEDWGL